MQSILRPLHIGKFMPGVHSGGMEVHLDTLLRSLVEEAKPTLVVSEVSNNRKPVLPSVPYRVIAVPSLGVLKSVAVSPGIVPTIRREVFEGRANLIHTHAPNPWGDIASFAIGRDIPFVITWHSDIVRQRMLLKFYGRLQQAALKRADRIVVFTPKHFESSVQLKLPGLEKKIVVVPIGIDFQRLDATATEDGILEDVNSWAKGRPIILSVGRHVYYKGYSQLISAMALTREPAVLALIGTGPLRAALQQQVEEKGLAERIRFFGEVDHRVLVTLLRRADIFCLPSIERSEAFGIAAAEGMACGKPAVVCELGNGVNYLHQAGHTSLVVPPRDEWALAEALDTLLGSESLRHEMGAAARAWVRTQFSVDAMQKETLQMYRSLS